MTQQALRTSPREVAVAIRPSDGPTTARPARSPRADCTADSTGGITFDVRLFDGAAKEPGVLDALGAAAVLLRLRRHHGPDASLRLPLSRATPGGALRATLPPGTRLREGRWDVFLALGDEEPQRLLPGVSDLRPLMDGVPFDEDAGLAVRIPYTTKYGNLTVRAWHRRTHAEAGSLLFADGTLVLSGRLHGALLTATACLEARPRDSAAAPVRVPVRGEGEERTRRRASAEDAAEGRGAESRFVAALPLGALPAGQTVWDLWLRPSETEKPVRLARILDDIPDKKNIFTYPAQQVPGRGGPAHWVKPYYTVDNDLSIQVRSEASERDDWLVVA